MAAGVECCIRNVCEAFGISGLFPEQKDALIEFVNRRDVFLNLPTGYGKSLVFQMAPYVHAELAKFGHAGYSLTPIVVVISPLLSLMEDQKSYLRGIGLKAASIGDNKEENDKIERGEFNIVFTSPESLLGNPRWRNMLNNSFYKENLIGITVDEAHCISHW